MRGEEKEERMAKTQKGMRGWRCANSRHARCSTRHAWKPLSAHLLSLQKLILSAKANYNIFKQRKPQKKSKQTKTAQPAGSEVERGGGWVLQFYSVCKPWYLQCFLMYESPKMCVIPVCFRISVFFPQHNANFIFSPWKNDVFLETFAFPTRFAKSNVRCCIFSLFSILSCFRQFVSARLQQIWILCVGKSPLKRSNTSRYLWRFGTQTARDGLPHLSPYWVDGTCVHRPRLVVQPHQPFDEPTLLSSKILQLCRGMRRGVMRGRATDHILVGPSRKSPDGCHSFDMVLICFWLGFDMVLIRFCYERDMILTHSDMFSIKTFSNI